MKNLLKYSSSISLVILGFTASSQNLGFSDSNAGTDSNIYGPTKVISFSKPIKSSFLRKDVDQKVYVSDYVIVDNGHKRRRIFFTINMPIAVWTKCIEEYQTEEDALNTIANDISEELKYRFKKPSSVEEFRKQFTEVNLFTKGVLFEPSNKQAITYSEEGKEFVCDYVLTGKNINGEQIEGTLKVAAKNE